MTSFFSQDIGIKSLHGTRNAVAETPPPHINIPRSYWVVFSGRADLWWLRLLRPGYRHCFALIRMRGQWLIFDPLASHTDIVLTELEEAFDLPRWYADHGFGVWQVSAPPAIARPMPWRLFTCVEAVKRLLGIRGSLILTPWQLLRALRRDYGARRIMPLRKTDLS